MASIASGAAGLTGLTGEADRQGKGLGATVGVSGWFAASLAGGPNRLAQPVASSASAMDASRPTRTRREEGLARQSGLENMGELDSEVGTDGVWQQLDVSTVRGNVFVHDGQTNSAAP